MTRALGFGEAGPASLMEPSGSNQTSRRKAPASGQHTCLHSERNVQKKHEPRVAKTEGTLHNHRPQGRTRQSAHIWTGRCSKRQRAPLWGRPPTPTTHQLPEDRSSPYHQERPLKGLLLHRHSHMAPSGGGIWLHEVSVDDFSLGKLSSLKGW